MLWIISVDSVAPFKSCLSVQRGGDGLGLLNCFWNKDDLEDDVGGGSSCKGFFCGSPLVHTNNPLAHDVVEQVPSCGVFLFGVIRHGFQSYCECILSVRHGFQSYFCPSSPSGMTSRATSCWRTTVHRVGGNRSFTTSTTPKSRAFAAPLHDMFGAGRNSSKAVVRGDFVPMYVALGMIVLSVSLGLLTAKHQLLYSLNVYVKKKRREMVSEVVDEAERFIHKSLFRRLAHVQEFDRVLDDPTRSDPLAIPKKVESLKTVGVDPSKY